MYDIYLAGSLRNPDIVEIHKLLKKETGLRVFSDWHAVGPEADDHWKTYYQSMGLTYRQALQAPASRNVYEFDKYYIDQCPIMVLALPAGKSGHLELGYHLGKDKKGYILLDNTADRWDVMYQFASGVTADIEELSRWINQVKGHSCDLHDLRSRDHHDQTLQA